MVRLVTVMSQLVVLVTVALMRGGAGVLAGTLVLVDRGVFVAAPRRVGVLIGGRDVALGTTARVRVATGRGVLRRVGLACGAGFSVVRVAVAFALGMVEVARAVFVAARVALARTLGVPGSAVGAEIDGASARALEVCAGVA